MAFSVSNIKYRLDRESIISLDTYQEFFSTAYYYRALRNSLVLGVVSTSLIIPIAFCYAYLGLKGPKIISRPVKILGLLPLIAPPFIFALALILIGGRQGILTKFLHLPFTIYGWPGIIIAQTITFLPLGYLLIQNVLRSLGSSLEEAAIDMGAGSFEVLRKITIPLAAPGILKAALLVFILSLADFGNPMLIGGGVSLLATDAYLLWIGENNLEMAAVFCVFLVLPSLTIFLIHEYLLKGREYTTIGGKPQQDEERKIAPNILYPMLAIIVPISLLILLCFGIIFMGAFTKIIMIDNSFTLEHFNTVNGIRSLITSVRFAFGAALIAPIIGVTLSYLLVRKRIPFKKVIESSALLGFAVPGTVMGIGYILFFNSPPLVLTGTFAIMILNEAFRNISVSLEAGISKLHQMDVSIEEAAIDMGANAFRVYTRIILPIISSAFVAGFIYTFMVGMIAVSAVIFLISPGNNLVALYILATAEEGFLGMACALSIMLIAVVLTCLGVLNLLSRYTGIRVY
jgi:iron(III) transport system permease protein